jgi:hypothetical protein
LSGRAGRNRLSSFRGEGGLDIEIPTKGNRGIRLLAGSGFTTALLPEIVPNCRKSRYRK